MGTNRIRYALIGLGHISQVAVLRAFTKAVRSELVALVSGDPAKRKRIAEQYAVPRTYSYREYDKCLSEVDAVYIALPNHLHHKYAVQAANAGVHVLCEKPLAINEPECRDIVNAGKRNKIKIMVAHRFHFEEGNKQALKIAKSGALGTLRFFTSDLSQPVFKGNVRIREETSRGGGPVYDLGIYCIHTARQLFSSEPVEVFARSANNGEHRFRKVDEMVSVLLRFPNQQLATFTCSFGGWDVGYYTLVGSKGTLVMDPSYEYETGSISRLSIGNTVRTRRFLAADQFAREISYFSDCIVRNREPKPSALEGLKDVKVIDAIYDSIRTGKSIAL